MPLEFYKYQGTGNDFILIDNRREFFPKNNTKLVAQMCGRKFGIGADGLILLEGHSDMDFRMVYYNSDGNLSSMCGNGGRCITHFASYLGIIGSDTTFEAVDGMHEASISEGVVSLKMNDVRAVEIHPGHLFVDTGSPHHVTRVDQLQEYDVFNAGRAIRTERYGKDGANVNFVSKISPSEFGVRTYERGVEDETLSCGTGVTAVALAMYESGEADSEEITLRTLGGELKVRFKKTGNGYTDIYLIGPAVQVFKGNWP